MTRILGGFLLLPFLFSCVPGGGYAPSLEKKKTFYKTGVDLGRWSCMGHDVQVVEGVSHMRMTYDDVVNSQINMELVSESCKLEYSFPITSDGSEPESEELFCKGRCRIPLKLKLPFLLAQIFEKDVDLDLDCSESEAIRIKGFDKRQRSLMVQFEIPSATEGKFGRSWYDCQVDLQNH